MTLFAVLAFMFGTIIGSFLNVVALRYNTGKSVGGRSSCFSCGKTLEWYELVPVISYFILRGRCSKCGSKISPQYPLVECTTGLLFLGIFLKYSPMLLTAPFLSYFILPVAISAIVASILMVIVVYDIEHTIIPDGLVYAFIAIGALIRIYMLVASGFSMGEIWNTLAGLFFFTFFFLLWFVSKGTWMGFGDAKLVLGIGLYLGLSEGLSALFLAFWIGSAYGLVLIFLRALGKGKTRLFGTGKEITMKSEIPFAPFLVIGLLLVFFFGINVFQILSFS